MVPQVLAKHPSVVLMDSHHLVYKRYSEINIQHVVYSEEIRRCKMYSKQVCVCVCEGAPSWLQVKTNHVKVLRISCQSLHLF